MKKYNDLFILIENIIKKQEEQKKRGLNNYNMVNVVRKATHEVGMHSNIIYSLINPNGEHFQGTLFLNLFIEKVLMPKLKLDSIEDFGEIYSVQAEESTEANRRIDFTIKSDRYAIGIEMKVNAGDLQHQISHYYEQLEKESDLNNKNNVYIFYLTKYGTNPSQKSIKIKSGTTTQFDPSKHVHLVSFEKDILNWVNASQKEVNNITNLNMALQNYKEIVKKITNQYKGNVMDIEEELLNNKKELLLALELDKKMSKIKGKTLYAFFQDLTSFLIDEGLNEDNTLNNYNARLVDENKCTAYFKKSKNRPKFFGKTFALSNGKILYVYVAIKSLCYGILDNSNLDSSFGETTISNSKFNTYIKNVKCKKDVQGKLSELVTDEDKFQSELLKYITKQS